MFGALGSTSGKYFHMDRQNGSKLKKAEWTPRVSPICLYKGSHAFAIFSAHALREWVLLLVHINVMTFTQFAQNCNVGSLLALYGSMHVQWQIQWGSTEGRAVSPPPASHPAEMTCWPC